MAKSVREVAARRDIIREGEKPRGVNLVLTGWACRYKQLPNGRRQLVALFIPGDLCDPHVFILKEMDHSIGALTHVTYAEIPGSEFEAMQAGSPQLTRAIWWNELVSVGVQREWTTNIGQRTAFERIAHLFCEVYARMRAAGLCSDGSCEFPLTQQDIADATGLTPVHVNRTIQDLRRQRLVELRSRTLTITNSEGLKDAAMFNPNYLHLERYGASPDAKD